MAKVETMAGVSYDGLFAGTEIPVLEKNLAFKSGAIVKRGQLVSVDGDGKGIATAANGTASFVAAEDVDATSADKAGTVYTSGYFVRERLIAAEGDTVTAHEAELRDVNIILSSMK